MKVDQESESKGLMGQYGPGIPVAGRALPLVPPLPPPVHPGSIGCAHPWAEWSRADTPVTCCPTRNIQK